MKKPSLKLFFFCLGEAEPLRNEKRCAAFSDTDKEIDEEQNDGHDRYFAAQYDEQRYQQKHHCRLWAKKQRVKQMEQRDTGLETVDQTFAVFYCAVNKRLLPANTLTC